jgi:hypothetical protein
MQGFFGLATLAIIGVIIADIAIHPQAFQVGVQGINQLAKTTFTGLLGSVPQ